MPSVSEHLDLTTDVCPMTVVRTRLALEDMAAGALLEVRLLEGESLDNVAAFCLEDGHGIVAREPLGGRAWRLVVRRGDDE
jgi:TusA-related sulfurtransferase